MIKYLTPLLTAAIITGCTATSELAQDTRIDVSERVVITWSDPANYTDVREANGNSQAFRDALFKELHGYMDEIAQNLPPGQTLNMTVSDVDLAGRIVNGNTVGLSSSKQIRYVQHTTFPKMAFSYELLNQADEVLLSGSKVIKNMALRRGINSKTVTTTLEHEKDMLQQWFNSDIDKKLASVSLK